MTVIALDRASASIRGELTRWFLEIKPGVFVGRVNAGVRDELWKRICTDGPCAGAVLVYGSNCEQGFRMELFGDPRRKVVDFEGVQLIMAANHESGSIHSSGEAAEAYIGDPQEFARLLKTIENGGVSDAD